MSERSPTLDQLDDDELTTAEAAAVLGVSPRTLQRLQAAGRIGFIRVGRARRVYFTRRDLAAYVDSLRRAP